MCVVYKQQIVGASEALNVGHLTELEELKRENERLRQRIIDLGEELQRLYEKTRTNGLSIPLNSA